jgi:hypothetical protein
VYCAQNIVLVINCRRIRWAGPVMHMAERRSVCSVLAEKSEGKRQLGQPRRRWGNNIKIDFQEVEFGGMDWIELAQDRGR